MAEVEKEKCECEKNIASLLEEHKKEHKSQNWSFVVVEMKNFKFEADGVHFDSQIYFHNANNLVLVSSMEVIRKEIQDRDLR